MALPTSGWRQLVCISDQDGICADIVTIAGVNRLRVETVGGGGGGVTTSITENVQVQNSETTTPLGAGGSFTSTARDYTNFEAMGVSVFVEAGAGALDVDVIIQQSTDNVTFRDVETVPLSGGVGASASLNRVYSVTRIWNRVRVVNNDGANALTVTEVVTMQKPIS